MEGALERYRELLEYDRWARLRVARSVAEAAVEAGAASPDTDRGQAGGRRDVGPGEDDPLARAVLIVSHLARTDDVWLTRVREGGPGPTGDLWRPLPAGELVERTETGSAAWRELVDGLEPSGLERVVTYSNSSGRTFEHRLEWILTHALNHGTHHRGQAVLLLRQADIAPPNTDYIAWIRDRETERMEAAEQGR